MESNLDVSFPRDFCWELSFGKCITRQQFKLCKSVERKLFLSSNCVFWHCFQIKCLKLSKAELASREKQNVLQDFLSVMDAVLYKPCFLFWSSLCSLSIFFFSSLFLREKIEYGVFGSCLIIENLYSYFYLEIYIFFTFICFLSMHLSIRKKQLVS